jgi:FkbM family methyltransferase
MTTSARRLVGRLLSALQTSLADDPHAVTEETALRGELRELRARVDEYEAGERTARDRARRLKSTAVDDQHLKLVLPLRAAALRDADDELSRTREAQFVEYANDYAAMKHAWTEGVRPHHVQATSDGLQWSIPSDHGDEHSLSRRIERGWLPLNDIATVRACAVGGVMLDVGANIGTTCIPRVVLGDFDCVYAAEPEPDNYACLVGNVLDNGLTGRVMPERVAIGSSNGTASLELMSRIGAHHLVAEPDLARGPLVEVPCFTIDSWLERLGVSPTAVSFVKVDTQGWDIEVLKGATALLEHKHVVWQLEITRLVKRSGETIQKFAELLNARFTHAKTLGGHSVVVKPLADVLNRLDRMVEDENFVNLLLLNRAEA